MTVEDRRGGGMDEDGFNDQFPVGMRVLAVDDDPICLKLLEGLLRKCQYHVTTTNQAVKALQMLRENRNKYDLVISDVNMPDMDGFKLLELVGLEMDLPVIMLSAHSDTKLVMKGITHGACDYLLKPVRIEELKNIWQHVIRRKKLDKDQSRSIDQDKTRHGTGDVGQGSASNGNVDPNGKLNRKRKDQNEDEEEEGEENGHESEDPSTQKKPRVVWSVELHRKFVAAVNQLGLDKAVPKKILDLMNVEGLTRENVASHLQKYRLYLKRISNVASQQATMVAAFGSKESYLRMGSLDGFGDFHSLAGSGRYPNASLSSYPAGGMLGRLNSSSSLSLRGITSSGVIQPAHSQSFSSTATGLGKLQPVGFPANQNANLFQGVPTSLEINQLQQHKGSNPIRDFIPIENSTVFANTTSFPDSRATLGSSSNPMTGAPSNSLMMQGNLQQAQTSGLLYNQATMRMAPSNSDSFEIGGNCSSDFLDHGRCNESWQGVGLSKFPSNSVLLNGQLPSNNFGENASSSNPIGFSSSNAVSTTLEGSRDMENQVGLIGFNNKPDFNHNLRQTYGNMNSLSSANVMGGPIRQSMDQGNAVCLENIDMSIVGQLGGGASVQQGDFDRSALDGSVRSNANYLLEQTKSQNNFFQNSYESLDDLMSAMIKREKNDTSLMDGETGYGAYPLGSCI